MVSTKLIALVAAVMAQEVAALNVHRHAHNKVHEKRADEVKRDVVTVTDWTIVTVYNDGSPVVPTTAAAQTFYKGAHADVHTTASSSSSSSSSSTSSTSTSSSSSSTSTSSTSSSSSTSTTSSSSSIPTPTTTSSSSSIDTTKLYPIYTTTSAYTPTTMATSTKSSSSSPIVASVSLGVYADAVIANAATTSSSTSAAATATSTTSSSSSSSGKRGLAYNDGSLMSPFLSSGTKCSWSYNWGQTAADDASTDVEFIPMLWSPSHADTWTDAADAAIASGSTALLSFNECDNAGQCNLDAASAATEHIKYMVPYSGQAKIGAPAITNSGNAGEGIEWLTSFISACDGQCAIDFCPLHWYNSPDADEFLEHVANVYAACGKPVWITEFAPISGSDSDISTFLETIMTAMDSDEYSYVERYSYFMAATGSMLTTTTELSTYGQTFAYY